VGKAVGPSAGATLLDCMCTPAAFVSASLLLTSLSIDLEPLLGECNAAHGTGVSYPGSVGGSCAQYS